MCDEGQVVMVVYAKRVCMVMGQNASGTSKKAVGLWHRVHHADLSRHQMRSSDGSVVHPTIGHLACRNVGTDRIARVDQDQS